MPRDQVTPSKQADAVDALPKWSEDERSESERNVGSASTAGAPRASSKEAPDPEVSAKAARRRFTAEHKLRIVREAEACTLPGQVGALLRREGLYSSHLQKWRTQLRAGALAGMAGKKRGPKPQHNEADTRRIADLERENRRLQRKLATADAIIDFQKKVHELLGIPLKSPDDDGSD